MEYYMGRIRIYSLLFVFCLAWGVGCGGDTTPDPERRGDVMKQKNVGADKSKEKAQKKGILADP
jgi:hypothetical protein